MAEGVVVELESVEVAEQDCERPLGARERKLLLEVGDQLAAVTEAGECIRDRFLAGSHPAAGHRGSDQQDTEQRERDRKRVDAEETGSANARGRGDDDPVVLGVRGDAEPPMDDTEVVERAHAVVGRNRRLAETRVTGNS